jgi:hypothetical protein
VNNLLHEAAALYGFVDFLCRFCGEQESSRVYGPASEEFFRYVRQLGKSTQDYLKATTKPPRRRRTWASQEQSRLALLKECWNDLHELIKPAADGHTLQTPSPLLTLVQEELRGIKGLEDARIVILVSPTMNYLQHPHGRLKLNLTGFTPEFPAGLGFIQIPYSKGLSVLTNTLIFHELAHFVFEELWLWGELEASALAALRRRLPDFDKVDGATQAWCQERLLDWSQEIFCDLFALSAIGPAYAFAYIELFSLLGLLNIEASKKFQDSHPADGFRFREQLFLLRRSGWWNAIKDLRCGHVRLITEHSAIREADYVFPDAVPGVDGQPLIQAFLDMTQEIRTVVTKTIGPARSGLPLFKRKNAQIQRCLANGVVPSAIVESDASSFRKAIINSAACFYLDSLEKLIDNVADRDSDNVVDRSQIADKVEMWTMKALEDCNLVCAQQRGD